MISFALTLLLAADTRAILAGALAREFGHMVTSTQVELTANTPRELDAQQGATLRRWGLRYQRSEGVYAWGRVPELRFRLPLLAIEHRLNTAKRKGQILDAADIISTPAAWHPGRPTLSVDVTGRQLLRDLPAQHLLRSTDLRTPTLIRRGAHVQAVHRSANYILRFPAISMRDGGPGETVLIRKPGEAKLLAAKVLAANIVELQ
jgi:hypothetical protein